MPTQSQLVLDARERVVNRIVNKKIRYKGHPITLKEAASIVKHLKTIIRDKSSQSEVGVDTAPPDAIVLFDFEGINWQGRVEYVIPINAPGEYIAMSTLIM